MSRIHVWLGIVCLPFAAAVVSCERSSASGFDSAAGDGGSSTSGGDVPAVGIDVRAADLVGKAFDLTFTYPPGAPEVCPGGCAGLVSLHIVSATDTRIEAILGTYLSAEPASFDRMGSSWTLVAAAPHGSTTLVRASIRFVQSAGGGAIEIIGTGTENSYFVRQGDDILHDSSSPVGITGRPLTRAPKFSSLPWDSLGGLQLNLDTPVDIDTTASVTGAGGNAVVLEANVKNGWIAGFSTTVIFPFATRLTLTVDTPASQPPIEQLPDDLRTSDDPGIAAIVDFETAPLVGVVTGSDNVVTGYMGLPAISGRQSLRLHNTSALLHLARPAGANTIVANVRAIAGAGVVDGLCAGGSFYLVAGTTGGRQRFTTNVQLGTDHQTMTSGATTFMVTPTREVRLTLDEAGPDVILLIGQQSGGDVFHQSQCAPGAGLADDIRVE